MSRLNDLIAELCPHGVEYKRLGDFTKVLRGKRLTRDQLSDDGQYPVFHGGLEPLGFYSKSNRPANSVMIINVGASAGTVGFCDKDFWSSDGCFTLENTINDSRYLYHALMFQENFLKARVRRAGIPTLDGTVVEKIQIPVPPIEVQREIVRILDTFTELTAELTAELVARKQQYEYYRDLLMFDVGSSVEFKRLGEVAAYGKERIDASNVDFNSYVGVDNLLPDKQGKTISSYVPNEGRLVRFMAGDILIGNIRPYLKKIWFAEYEGGTNGDVLVIRVTADSLSPKFLYYCLSSDKFFHYAVQFSKGAKMPRGDKSATMDFLIPVPSLEEQESIVKILDRFDRLCNDLSEGLPAEIEVRKQQYEFYRDKLLSFDKDWR